MSKFYIVGFTKEDIQNQLGLQTEKRETNILVELKKDPQIFNCFRNTVLTYLISNYEDKEFSKDHDDYYSYYFIKDNILTYFEDLKLNIIGTINKTDIPKKSAVLFAID